MNIRSKLALATALSLPILGGGVAYASQTTSTTPVTINAPESSMVAPELASESTTDLGPDVQSGPDIQSGANSQVSGGGVDAVESMGVAPTGA